MSAVYLFIFAGCQSQKIAIKNVTALRKTQDCYEQIDEGRLGSYILTPDKSHAPFKA